MNLFHSLRQKAEFADIVFILMARSLCLTTQRNLTTLQLERRCVCKRLAPYQISQEKMTARLGTLRRSFLFTAKRRADIFQHGGFAHILTLLYKDIDKVIIIIVLIIGKVTQICVCANRLEFSLLVYIIVAHNAFSQKSCQLIHIAILHSSQ